MPRASVRPRPVQVPASADHHRRLRGGRGAAGGHLRRRLQRRQRAARPRRPARAGAPRRGGAGRARPRAAPGGLPRDVPALRHARRGPIAARSAAPSTRSATTSGATRSSGSRSSSSRPTSLLHGWPVERTLDAMASLAPARSLDHVVSALVQGTAIVTGGGSGIGRAIAEAFAARGVPVALVDLLADGARRRRGRHPEPAAAGPVPRGRREPLAGRRPRGHRGRAAASARSGSW